MKTFIKLSALTLTNFKGIQNLHIDFSNETSIYGANEAGKTTISDAWHWLLTGKDSLDREKFNIKNTVHTELNRSNHEVTAEITVNDEVIKLRRVYKEDWVKPKGQPAAIYSGNSQEYYVNDVPKKAGEYQKVIADFLDESYLKMLTNPAYFNRLKWQEQRPVLTSMAGTISNTEVLDKIATLHNKQQILEITNVLNSGKSLADHKKVIGAAKKLKKDRLDELPARIDEATRSLPDIIDFEAIQKQLDDKLSAVADIDTLIADETKAYNLANTKNTERLQKINQLGIELMGIENGIRQQHQQAANTITNKINEAKNNVLSVEQNITSKKNLIASTQGRIDTLKAEKAKLLEQWQNESARVLVYDEHKFTCPTCMRALDVADIESAKAKMQQNFNEEVQKNKDAINVKGQGVAKQITEANTFIESIQGQINLLEADLTFNQTLLTDLNSQVSAPVDVNELIAGNPKVIALKAEIEALKAENTDVQPINIEQQKAAKAALTAEISELQITLAGKGQRDKAEKRIEELRAEERNLSQEIADYENIEFAITAFDNAKITETETRVNQLFGGGVTFKMFDKTIDGNLVDTCQAMFKGVPYADLNTAGKVQCGLIIINALSTFYGVSAPIFIDNKESVSTLPVIESQIINLIVSPEDKKLRVVNGDGLKMAA